MKIEMRKLSGMQHTHQVPLLQSWSKESLGGVEGGGGGGITITFVPVVVTY